MQHVLSLTEKGIAWYRNGAWRGSATAVEGLAILSGSFNPLHAGHLKLRQAAQSLLGQEVIYELPVANAEKGVVAVAELARRLQQFPDDEVAVTSAATFHRKSILFPAATFVVGYDTAVRLLQPRYYRNSEAAMLDCLLDLLKRGVHFAVGGRLCETGRFATLADLPVPARISSLFIPIPESRFRADISSTALRNGSL